jgi:membrane protein implicated in regulation of membrane protease activity
MILRVVVVLLVLATAAGAVVFFLAGPWQMGALFVLVAVGTVLVAFAARAADRQGRPPTAEYVERESHLY